MSTRPFPIWFIERDYLTALLSGKIVALAAFDLAGFVWLGPSIGLNVELSSQKEAAKMAQAFRTAEIPTWSGRMLRYNFGSQRYMPLGSGMFSRFLNDLTNPLPLMTYDRDHGPEMIRRSADPHVAPLGDA